MNSEKYKMACDDVDPESQCSFSAQGNSVDEVYQKMISHGKAQHPEKINSLSPRQLQKLEKDMRDFMEKQVQTANHGVIGYALLWWLGVPISILLLIFVLRGFN